MGLLPQSATPRAQHQCVCENNASVKDEKEMATQTNALIEESVRASRANIPDIVIGRLPIYLRTLEILASEGQAVASSQELGYRLGISSAQIRKDLSHFGEFGKQGTGYDVAYLRSELEKILQVDCVWSLVLVGAGYLGHALGQLQRVRESWLPHRRRIRQRRRQDRNRSRQRAGGRAHLRHAATGARYFVSHRRRSPCPPGPRRPSPTR